MVMDTLRAAVRHLAASSLDYTGWRLSGQRDRPVRAEFHSGRNHWWFCPGLAADRGGVVCAANGVAVGCWSTVKTSKKCEVAFLPPHTFYTIQIVWIISPHQKKDQHLKFHQIVQHILFYLRGADISPKG